MFVQALPGHLLRPACSLLSPRSPRAAQAIRSRGNNFSYPHREGCWTKKRRWRYAVPPVRINLCGAEARIMGRWRSIHLTTKLGGSSSTQGCSGWTPRMENVDQCFNWYEEALVTQLWETLANRFVMHQKKRWT